MKTKILLTAVLLGASSATALANGFNGFVGLAGGANFFTENRNAVVQGVNPFSHKLLAASSNDAYANDSAGFSGDLKIGGTYTYRAFELGLVADAQAQTGKSTLRYSNRYTETDKDQQLVDSTVSSKGYESMPFSFGVSLQPGLNISNNAEVYVNVGGRLGQFKSHLPTAPAAVDGTGHYIHYGTDTAYNGDFTKWAFGIDAGLGFSSYFTIF